VAGKSEESKNLRNDSKCVSTYL